MTAVQLDLGAGVFVAWYGPSNAIPQVGDVIERDGKGWKVAARIWSSTGFLVTLRCVEERNEYLAHLDRKAQQPRLVDSAEVEN